MDRFSIDDFAAAVGSELVGFVVAVGQVELRVVASLEAGQGLFLVAEVFLVHLRPFFLIYVPLVVAVLASRLPVVLAAVVQLFQREQFLLRLHGCR